MAKKQAPSRTAKPATQIGRLVRNLDRNVQRDQLTAARRNADTISKLARDGVKD